MAEMGMAGFRTRKIRDNDPLVCGCGVTLGTQALTKPENKEQLDKVVALHSELHKVRLKHQNIHRGPANDCPYCPVKGVDYGADS